MPRPCKYRTVHGEISVRFFKPQGVPMRDLQGLTLGVDGLEALRLADAEGLEHAAAAEMMGISRPTFSRLLASARATTATALSRGWAIRIEGGAVAPAAQGTGENALPPVGGGRGRGLRRRRGHCGRAGAAVPLADAPEFQEEEDDDAQS
ncbi:DUF134 domain-containing protein [Oleispirillum naphthae]|uniref:DUF134 domain-containing protein n=1 Tax=Oleispirillum naphthae TaxID=2838853 RepID=UPI00308267F5